MNIDTIEKDINDINNKYIDAIHNVGKELNRFREIFIKILKMPSEKNKQQYFDILYNNIYMRGQTHIDYNFYPDLQLSIDEFFLSNIETEKLIKYICQIDDFEMFAFLIKNDIFKLNQCPKNNEDGDYKDRDYNDLIVYYVNIIINIIKYSSVRFLEKYNSVDPIFGTKINILGWYYYMSLIEFRNYTFENIVYINSKNHDILYRYTITPTIPTIKDLILGMLMTMFVKNIYKHMFKKTLLKILDEYQRFFINCFFDKRCYANFRGLLENCHFGKTSETILDEDESVENIDQSRYYLLLIIRNIKKKYRYRILDVIDGFETRENLFGRVKDRLAQKEAIYFLIENNVHDLLSIRNINHHKLLYNTHIESKLQMFQDKSYMPKDVCKIIMKYSSFCNDMLNPETCKNLRNICVESRSKLLQSKSHMPINICKRIMNYSIPLS